MRLWRESAAYKREEEAERIGELGGAGYAEARGQMTPRGARIRSNSSGLRLCAATTSGVMVSEFMAEKTAEPLFELSGYQMDSTG